MPVKITPEHELYSLAHALKMRALREYRYITPVARRKTFEECYNICCGKLCFWFNKPCGSTAMLSVPIPEAVHG